MVKRNSKRSSRHSYDDDDFENDLMDDESEEDFEDYDSEEDEDYVEEEDEEDGDEEEHSGKSSKKRISSKKHSTDKTLGKEMRLKAFWTVYGPTFSSVETYDYADKEKALAKAKELTEAKKATYFVKLDKKVIES